MRTPPSWPNYLPRFPFPHIVLHLGIRVSIYEILAGGKNSPQLMVEYIHRLTCWIGFSSTFLGGRDSRGVGHHRLGDFALAASGFPVHHLLCLQVLPGQEEKAWPIHNLKSSVRVHVPQVSGLYKTAALKPHLMNSPSPPCQTLEVPLCPDFELACPPLASIKAKLFCVCSCVKRAQVQQSRLCLWSVLRSSGLMKRN